MHPKRHAFLAYRRNIQRAIVSREINADGTCFTLECGHKAFMPPHFNGKLDTHHGCFECSMEYVRTAPEYAKEWQTQ